MKKEYTFDFSYSYNKIKTCFYTIIFLFFVSNAALAQGPGSLFVDAGPDVNIDCGGNPCVDLTATFLETYETISETYTVESIPYNPPFPFNGLANSVNTNIDDAWSSVGQLPFDLCFFGNIETEFQVGSNGVIRFDVDPGDTSNGWSFSEDLPNNSNPTLGEANVFTPVHDIDPSVNNVNEIAWEITGEFPNRVLVVSYFEVPMFSGSCNNLLATHMAVFYEFSNVVEVYIQDKPSCPTWNGGNAAVGIQNDDGNIAYVPPGRNTSDSPWTTTNEAWSFTPDGAPTYVFEWLDASGTVISNNPTINVCPDGAETYTARITYTNCNGDEVVLTDDVTVTPVSNFTVDLGEDQEFCDVESFEIVPDIDGIDPSQATYLWSTGETTPTISVSDSDTYSVDVTFDGCTETDSIELQFEEDPIIDLGDDFSTCFENTVVLDATPSNYPAGAATYEWSLDGVVIAGATSPTLTVTVGGTYSVFVTVEFCSSNDTIVISPRTDLEVSLGDDFKSCPNEPQTLQAVTSENGVTFEWQLNGETIEGETGSTLEVMLEEGVMGTQVYTVIITKGDCTGTDDLNIEPYDVGNCVISQGISPNGSPGFNDQLDLEFLSDRAGGILQLQIFNRLGNLVYQRNNYVNEWVGQTDDGNELPTGTYFYVIDLASEDPVYGAQATGWIYLNRDAN